MKQSEARVNAMLDSIEHEIVVHVIHHPLTGEYETATEAVFDTIAWMGWKKVVSMLPDGERVVA